MPLYSHYILLFIQEFKLVLKMLIYIGKHNVMGRTCIYKKTQIL